MDGNNALEFDVAREHTCILQNYERKPSATEK